MNLWRIAARQAPELKPEPTQISLSPKDFQEPNRWFSPCSNRTFGAQDNPSSPSRRWTPVLPPRTLGSQSRRSSKQPGYSEESERAALIKIRQVTVQCRDKPMRASPKLQSTVNRAALLALLIVLARGGCRLRTKLKSK